MQSSDLEKIDDLADELLLATDLESVQEIAWNIKEIVSQNKHNDLLTLAKFLMYAEAERLTNLYSDGESISDAIYD